MSSSCTICAGQSCRRTAGATGDNLVTVFGVTLVQNSITDPCLTYPLCSSCHLQVNSVVGLRQELVRLENEVKNKVAQLQSLVAASFGAQFDLPAAQLRSQLLGGQSSPSSQNIHQIGQYFDQSSASSAPPPTLDHDQPQIPVPDANYSPSNDEDFDQSDVDEPYHPEITHSSPPPPKKRKIRGKMSEEQKAKMLAARSATEVETFAPVQTSEDGRQFYEGHEIVRLPSGNLQCGTCSWKETNHSSRPLGERMKSIKIHVKGIHLGAYKCDICKIELSSLKSLRGHQKGVACGRLVQQTSSSTSYQCDGCSEVFSLPGNLRKHKKTLKCGDQGLKIATTPSNKSTKKSKSKPRYPCTICGRPVPSAYLPEHSWTHKSAEERAEATAAGRLPRRRKKSQCPDCGKMISTEYFALHLNTHKEGEDQAKVQCGVEGCGRLFPNRITLRQHQTRMHERQGLLPCPELDCKRKFATKKDVVNHMKRIHNRRAKVFQCEYCNSAWAWSHQLKLHLKVHEREKHTIDMFQHLCTACPLKFRSEKLLKSHSRMKHLLELCPNDDQLKKARKRATLDREEFSRIVKMYKTKGKTKRPIQAPEKLSPFKKVGAGKLDFCGFKVLKKKDGYICITCGKEFKWEEEGEEDDDQNIEEETKRNRAAAMVKRHIKAVHREDYKCEICDYVATTTRNLNQHRRRHIVKDAIPCTVCQKPIHPHQIQNHAWTHRGIEELVKAINSGEKLPSRMKATINPPKFSDRSMKNRRSLLLLEQNEFSIKCDHCPSKPNSDQDEQNFATPASLFHHILEKHPNVGSSRVKNRKTQDSTNNMNPVILQLPKIAPKVIDDTTVLFLDGKMIGKFLENGKILLC